MNRVMKKIITMSLTVALLLNPNGRPIQAKGQPTKIQTTIQQLVRVESIPEDNICIIDDGPNKIVEEKVIKKEQPQFSLSDDEIELIALVTMAEAENQCEEGQRLVIDTILNRVDSSRFPNSVHDVLYAKGQFTSMWNGRADRCIVKEELLALVKEELISRHNSEVVYFSAGGFFSWATPLFKVGDHYFSTF